MMNRVLLRVNTDETWQWLLIRVLIEEGLFYLYTFETEKANPFFRKAMECRHRFSDHF